MRRDLSKKTTRSRLSGSRVPVRQQRDAIVCSRWLLAILLPLSTTLLAGCFLFRPFSSTCAVARQIQLLPNQSLTLPLSAQEKVCLHVSIQAGQRFKFNLSTRETEAGIILRLPGNEPSLERHCRENNTIYFAQTASSSADLHLEAYSREKEIKAGQITIALTEISSARETDRLLMKAETLFSQADLLRAQAEAPSLQAALQKYLEAILLLEQADDTDGLARTHKAAGDLYRRQGESLNASEQYQRALRSARDPGLQSELLSQLSGSSVLAGQYSQAENFAQRALLMSRDACDTAREAMALNALGEAYYGYGNRWQALAQYHHALKLWERLSDRRGQAESLLFLGTTYIETGEPEKAPLCFERALKLSESVNDLRGRAFVQIGQAGLALTAGKSQEAINLYSESLLQMQRVGDRFWQASIVLNTGAVYQSLGDYDRALSWDQQALTLWRELNASAETAGVLSVIGGLHYLKQDHERALDYLHQALELATALSDKKYASNALRKIGAIHAALNHLTEARQYYQQALQLHRDNGEKQGEAFALLELGKLARRSGGPAEARRYFEQTLTINRTLGSRQDEMETLYQLATTDAESGRFQPALAALEQSLNLAESLRSSVSSQNLRATYFATVRQHYDLSIHLLMRMHQQQPHKAFAARALRISERARARGLLELLTEAAAEIRQGVDQQLLRRERELNDQTATLIERREQLIRLNAPPEGLNKLAEEFNALSLELEKLETQIRRESPRYAALTQPQPLSPENIRQQLTKDTLLLEFFLGEKQSCVWAITQSGLKGYELPDRATLETLTRRFYDLTRPGAMPNLADSRSETERQQLAEKLSSLLRQPLADHPDKQRLIIVADGVLQYLPFAALPLPQRLQKGTDSAATGAGSSLNQHYEISHLPSASVLSTLREDRKNRQPAPNVAVVFADPAFTQNDKRVIAARARNFWRWKQTPADQAVPALDLPRLRATSKEVALIEQLVPDAAQRLSLTEFQASRSLAVNAELNQYRIVHFGTHGLINQEHPELTAIVLSMFDDQGNSTDGRLRLNDVYNLRLNADLVVLSACDTALGKEVPGEGLIGLTRGFMYAGASRVLASLWKVDDDATSQFMRYFYESLLRDKLNPSQALSQAQRQMMQHPRYHHPRYWAAFVLQGE